MSNPIATIEAKASPLSVSSSRQRLKTWARVLSHFLAGQACLQAVNAVTGLLLLRWLSVTAYAQYSIAFGFQSMFAMLVDLGFSGTIVALVGDRVNDKEVVGKYISSAQYYRQRLFMFMFFVALVAYPTLTYRHHWNIGTNLLLFGTIVSSIFFQGWGMYASPLLMHRQMKQIYVPQIVSGVWRLLFSFALHIAGQLSAWTTALFNTAALALSGLMLRHNAKIFIQESAKSDTSANQEMLRYMSPGIPGIIFGAFQGQIILGLISIFGHTSSIAEVAALGRLGQIFTVLAAFNGVVVEPTIAKTAHGLLLRRYIIILLSSLALASILFSAAKFLPGIYLWLLGPKYHHLRSEVKWVVLASCFTYIAQVLWAMNSARKWMFWWASAVYIGLILSVQIVCMVFLNLSTTSGVIFLSLATSIAILIVQIFVGVYGFICGAPQTKKAHGSAVECRK